MGLENTKAIIVFENEEQKKVYAGIAESAGLEKISFIEFNKAMQSGCNGESKRKLAEQVAEAAGRTRSVVIGRLHYLMAYCYEKTPALIFDAHNDYYTDFKNMNFEFGDGNFLYWRQGPTYIIGTRAVLSDERLKGIYGPRTAWNAVKELEGVKELYLSLDIDVFNKKTTKAHGYLGDGKMRFEPVLRISREITEKTELKGINIAEYDPSRDRPDYKTANMLAEYLIKVTEGWR